MKICHISDTHGMKLCENTTIPECDVLIHSGDYSPWKGNLNDLTKFLIWFESQPAKVKIFTAGNHDLVLDKKWAKKREDSINRIISTQLYQDAKLLIESYKVKYLENKEYVYEGVKFWGSPYSPTFGSDWAFNADRGSDIKTIWGLIPDDVNVLITHTPCFGILDEVPTSRRSAWHKDGHVGCEDLRDIIIKKLTNLKLHCFGHIHDNYGIVIKNIAKNKKIIFSNGARMSDNYEDITNKPYIIEI